MTPDTLQDIAEMLAWRCADERPERFGAWSDEPSGSEEHRRHLTDGLWHDYCAECVDRRARKSDLYCGRARPGQSRRDAVADAETLRAYDFARTSPKAAQLYTADWRGRSAAEHMQCAIEDGIFIGPRRPMSGRYAGFEPYASGYWGARYAAKAAFRAVPGLRGRR